MLVSAFIIQILRSFWHLIYFFSKRKKDFQSSLALYVICKLSFPHFIYCPEGYEYNINCFAFYFIDKWVYNFCVVFEVSIIEHVPYFHAIESYVKNFFIIKFRVLIALFYSFLCYTGDYSPSTIHYYPSATPRGNNEWSRVNNPRYSIGSCRIKPYYYMIMMP